METAIQEKLDNIQQLLKEQYYLLKEVFDVEEASMFLNRSVSDLHKKVNLGTIPFSQPEGKGSKLYFSKAKLTKWALQNEHDDSEVEKDAVDYVIKNKRP